MVVMAATAPMLAALVRPAVDGAIGRKDQEMLHLVLMGVVALFAVRALAGYAAACSASWLVSKLAKDLRIAIFDKCLELPARYFATHTVGSLVLMLVSSTVQTAQAFITLITVGAKDVLTVLGLLGWAFYLNWRLSAIALSAGAFIVLVIRPLASQLEKVGSEMGPGMESGIHGMASMLKESAENQAALKLYGGQRYESRRAREQTEVIHRFLMKRTTVAAISIPFWQVTVGFVTAVIIYHAVGEASTGAATSGSLASVAAALAMLYRPLKRLSSVNQTAREGWSQVQDIFSLLDEPAESDPGSAHIERVRGELRFERVRIGASHSRYPEGQTDQLSEQAGNQAFEIRSPVPEINLTVHPGEMVALVGFQESTVTALAELVPLFFHPSGGKIFLDGQDLETISLDSLRANIALVSAEAMLFNDTLAANIAFGDMSEATEARIMAAAYAAHVIEFARKLPEGMQTSLDATGTGHPTSLRLTSGQRFCVAAARALLKNSPILIVDEAGEALDAESAALAEAGLKAAATGRTTLIIARRLSTVKKAGRIVLLDKGRVVATGTHSELLANSPLYARLVRTFT